MKKLLVLMMVVAILLPVIGTAEFNLKDMTDEQLIVLNKELAVELFNRGKAAFIPMGTYIIGENIPEGEYELTLDASNYHEVLGSVYHVYEKSNSTKMEALGRIMITNSVGRIVLKKGNVLELQHSGILMRKLLSLVIEFK